MLDRLSHEKLKWNCRRGLLELDLVLGRFLETEAAGLDERALASIGELLELPDNDLWDIVKGASEAYAPRLQDMVALLRRMSCAEVLKAGNTDWR